jgi:hypothetical protein
MVMDNGSGGNNGSQDWVADYDGEGREWTAREGGDSGVVMMAAAKMAAADNNKDSGGQRRQTTMALKIRWRTTTRKVESGWQTT